MPNAARVGDTTAHSGQLLGPGVPTVLVGGRPAVALGDTSACPQHGPSAVTRGSTTVLLGGRPAARTGDTAACGDVVTGGDPTVIVGG